MTWRRSLPASDLSPMDGCGALPANTLYHERLETLAAGTADVARVPGGLVPARSDGGARADCDARAGGDRLRAGLGRSRNLRALRHDRASTGLRGLWAK